MNWRCQRCGKTMLGTKVEYCPICHETFGGTGVGDSHRVGPHDLPDARHCRGVAQMAVLGWFRDQKGVWHGSRRPGEAVERLRGKS